MNSCGYQRKSAMGSYEERRTMEVDSMVCPKPRRLGLSNPSLHHHFRPLRLPINVHQTDMGDSMVGAELLDMILTKEGCGGERLGNEVASSPPFYCGSPPSRASNPVVQDAQFGTEKITLLTPSPLSPSSSSALKRGGFGRTKFGHKSAAIRIEGFDCLSRDRRNCSISSVA